MPPGGYVLSTGVSGGRFVIRAFRVRALWVDLFQFRAQVLQGIGFVAVASLAYLQGPLLEDPSSPHFVCRLRAALLLPVGVNAQPSPHLVFGGFWLSNP